MTHLHLLSRWPAEKVAPLVPQIIECLQKFVDRFPDDETVQNLCQQIEDGALQLWAALDGDRVETVGLTQIKTITATGKVQCLVHVAGGEGGLDIGDYLADIEKWAMKQGASEMEIIGRKGWERKFPELGYRATATVFRKKLERPFHG